MQLSQLSFKPDKNRVIDWALSAFGIIGALIGVFKGATVCVYFLGSYILILFAAAFVREWFFYQQSRNDKALISNKSKCITELTKSNKQKEKYYNCLKDLHLSAHYLRDSYSKMLDAENLNKDILDIAKTHLEQSLDKFSSVFKTITGRHCRACIKYVFDVCEEPISNTPTFYTVTLVRTDKTSSIAEKNKEYPLEGNSDFLLLFNKRKNIFRCNDLSSLKAYRNSNWPDNEDDLKCFIENQKYDYISTIVWPIRSCGDDVKVVGFLCVDSIEKDTFCKVDEEIGAIIADTLYPVITEYRKIRMKLNQEEVARP